MAAALLLSSLGLLPTWCAAYDIVCDWIVPAAAVMYMLDADLSRLASTGGATLLAFILGAAGTVIGTLLAWQCVGPKLGSEGWKVASALCATYIGGAINFAATAKALHLSTGALLLSAIAADNVAMGVYLAIISAIPADDVTVSPMLHSQPPSAPEKGEATPRSLAATLAMAATCCALGSRLAELMGFPAVALAAATAIASVVRPAAKAMFPGRRTSEVFAGAPALGNVLMLLFFATVGASCGCIGSALTTTPWLCTFILLQLLVHTAIIIGGGRAMGLPMQAILVASNANVGGPGTAAGTAAARGWPQMVQPGVLTGSLGYAIATFIACGISVLLQ
ncbi:unnamed protein product [Ostreobium quekettii]|uniref:DUF819-domain-containing protein n=1 Tax=Ostreobium quekettii TaxID=121088 RepID=A0A8S1IWX4_9CHLO|nr:unnamed protein product [Ostreobium quekettii]